MLGKRFRQTAKLTLSLDLVTKIVCENTIVQHLTPRLPATMSQR